MAACVVLGICGLSGCDDDNCVECLDTDPPAVPTGVHSVTGNELVTIWWNDIYQSDLASYLVYRDDDGDGLYDYIGTVDWDENFDADTGQHWFVDTDVVNGLTYDYAVSSMDGAGNESELSFETVFDTPRPDGNVRVDDYETAPGSSGFNFSLAADTDGAQGVVPGDSGGADMVVRWIGNVPFVQAAVRTLPALVEIQDFGSVMTDDGSINPDWLSYAPLYGYSATGLLEVVQGHAYVVHIIEDPDLATVAGDEHYAKFVVRSIGQHSVTMNWAYQVADGNRELKAQPSSPRPPVTGPVVRSDLVRF